MSLEFMNNYRNKPLFWFGVRLGALVVLFVVGYLAILLITTGTLTVTTGTSNATITVSSIPPLQRGPNSEQGNTSATVKDGTGSLTAHVRSGKYVVTVRSGSSQESELVNVGWLAHKMINLKPTGLTATEPVLYESVQGIAADSSHLIYLNNAFNGIEYINNQNQATPISGNQYFTSVAWADPQFGVAQDNAGKLYVVDGTTASPLKSPLTNFASNGGATYAIAPNRTIYIGFQSNVYRGTAGGNFTQIYSGFTSSDSLVAANNQVMVINPNTGGSNGGSATIINSSGKASTKNFGYSVGNWTPWSKNGKYIVLSVDSEPELFDSSLNLVGPVPELAAINGGAWLDDNTLYYALGGQLWSYNVSQDQSSLMATLPGQQAIQGVSISSDGSYVYLTASNNNDVYPRAVYRVGLKGQSVSSDLSALQDVLPIDGSTYTIGLRNFLGTPVIDITTYPGTDPSGVLQSAQSIIQGMVSLNDVNFDVEAGD
jgi:hypothetical protein